MADSIYTFDPTAGNNSSLDGIGYAEGQLTHGNIDNMFRAFAAKLAQFVDDVGGVNTVGGTANAITVSLASGITAYASGLVFAFKAGSANTGAATMNVNSIGAKAIRRKGDSALSAGDIAANGVYLVRYDTAYNAAAGAFVLLNPEITAGHSNKIINGDGRINQRAATTAADDAYAHDRHYALTQTGSIGISTLTAPADGIGSMMRLTQSQASAQRMGYAQIIEATEVYGLRGKTVTLGGKLRYSNAAAVRYAIVEWTGTADAVTSDVVADWTSGTFTAGNFFNSTTLTVRQVGSTTPSAATITNWSMTATVGSSANNLIVFYWTEGTAAQNSTLDMRWYLVEGDATAETDPFAPRHIQQEIDLCQRYYCKSYDIGTAPGTVTEAGAIGGIAPNSANAEFMGTRWPTVMRAAPTVVVYSTSNGAAGYIYNAASLSNVASGVITVSSKGAVLHNAGPTDGNLYLAQYTADAEI